MYKDPNGRGQAVLVVHDVAGLGPMFPDLLFDLGTELVLGRLPGLAIIGLSNEAVCIFYENHVARRGVQIGRNQV